MRRGGEGVKEEEGKMGGGEEGARGVESES